MHNICYLNVCIISIACIFVFYSCLGVCMKLKVLCCKLCLYLVILCTIYVNSELFNILFKILSICVMFHYFLTSLWHRYIGQYGNCDMLIPECYQLSGHIHQFFYLLLYIYSLLIFSMHVGSGALWISLHPMVWNRMTSIKFNWNY